MRRCIFLAIAWIACSTLPARAFDLEFTIGTSGSLQFTPAQTELLSAAIVKAEAMWETVILGYQDGINLSTTPVTLVPTTSGLASANYTGTTFQGGFQLATSGRIQFNVNEVANFANWQGPGANGLSFLDEILAHETGHVLGIGTLWTSNGVYVNNTYQYTGQHGLAAYRAEFDPQATFVPVENAGGAGAVNAHWDQIMRSSTLEGNPSDPWSLDPRLGITDPYGRDLALELMTGAIDPDWGEPFLSRPTVESMRDLGFSITAFEDFNGDGVVDLGDLAILNANFGATGLDIDSIRFGDANRDRTVDMTDYLLWEAAAVAEPAAWWLALTGMVLAAGHSWKRRR